MRRRSTPVPDCASACDVSQERVLMPVSVYITCWSDAHRQRSYAPVGEHAIDLLVRRPAQRSERMRHSVLGRATVGSSQSGCGAWQTLNIRLQRRRYRLQLESLGGAHRTCCASRPADGATMKVADTMTRCCQRHGFSVYVEHAARGRTEESRLRQFSKCELALSWCRSHHSIQNFWKRALSESTTRAAGKHRSSIDIYL